MSKECQDFIMGTICFEPDDRMSATQSLHDIWIKKNVTMASPNRKLLESCEQSMREFRVANLIQKASLLYLV